MKHYVLVRLRDDLFFGCEVTLCNVELSIDGIVGVYGSKDFALKTLNDLQEAIGYNYAVLVYDDPKGLSEFYI